MVSDSAGVWRRPHWAGSTRARAVVAIIGAAAVMLAAAACGGSPSSTGSGGTSDAGAPPNTQSVNSQPLAFSHCMRANGVPNFPDPNSSGEWPKPQVEGAAIVPSTRLPQRLVGTCSQTAVRASPRLRLWTSKSRTT